MAQFQVEITKDTTNLAALPALLDEIASAAMQAVTERVVGQAGALSPVYRGFFKNSLAPEVTKPSPLVIQGAVVSPLNYAAVIEGVDAAGNETQYGRRPGARMPPFEVLREWVVRVLAPKIEQSATSALKAAGLTRRKTATAAKAGKRAPGDEAARRERAIDSLTFLVGRSIASRGLPREGYPYFRPIARAAKELDSFIDQIFREQVPAELEARL